MDEFTEYIKERPYEEFEKAMKSQGKGQADGLVYTEEYFKNNQNKLERADEDGVLSDFQSIEEVYEELKCFKDCTIEEFEDIFGVKCNTSLPLYVNMYILKEMNAFYFMVDAVTNRFTVPAVIGLNTAWYYYLRYTQTQNKTIKFSRVGRTAFITLLYNLLTFSLYANPTVRQTYRVNINHLFDHDVPFLYTNDNFKCLIRRINSRQNHLINPSFEIDPEVLKENKEIDQWYHKQDQQEASKKRILPPVITEMINNTFNITNKIRHNPYEDLIDRYEEFFSAE